MKKLTVQKGQILYIIAIAMVALMGFTALGIDGTTVYKARRVDQGAADAASLAGAGAVANYIKQYPGFSCSSTSGTTDQNAEALARLKAHNAATAFKDSNGDAVNLEYTSNTVSANSVTTSCGTNADGVAYILINVNVSSSVKTNFLKVITNTPIQTKVKSTSKVTSSKLGSMLEGQGMVSLSSSGCGMDITSTPVKITGGGVFDNSNICSNWAPSFNTTDCIGVVGSVDSNFTNGSQTIVGPGFCSPKPTQITTSAIQSMFSTIPAPPAHPTCSSYQQYTWSYIVSHGAGVYCFPNNKSLALSFADAGSGVDYTVTIPGTVQLVFSGTGGFSINGGTFLTLNFGELDIWLVNGDFYAGGTKFSVPNTFRLYSTGTSTTPNISFDGGSTDTFGDAFFYVNAADFDLPGSINFIATAPAMGPYKGIILYMPLTNTQTVTINGGGLFSTTGSIMLPGGTLQLQGSSTTAVMNSQIVANKITVGGGSTININYDEGVNYGGDGSPITIDILK